MTSWLRKYGSLILNGMVLLSTCFSTFILTAHSAADRCTSALVTTCDQCLHRGPECAWCFQEGFLQGAWASERCDTVTNLIRKGCAAASIENPHVAVTANATLSSTQVAPPEVNIQLRPGSEASFVMEVRQLDRYPVDMYYLVDVSASMQDNLDRLKTVGVALSQRMREHTSDFRVGFGSFVDKPVSPYIDVQPSKIINPCSSFEIQCRPAHGFIHVLSVTENVTEFTRVVQQQRISGNMDTPEGGFDAMLQATVCQSDIGWRPEAKRLLLVMTDQPSHLALDSKLAGIVVPHDGNCHLENNSYTQSANMEHPTVGQLAEKLLQNGIHSIFAVEQGQYKWYEDLTPLLPGSYLGRLLPKAANLKDLVVEAYKKLLSDVEVEIGVQDQQVQRFRVDVTAFCPEGSQPAGPNKCSNVRPNQTVLFNITVAMRDCPRETEEVMILVKPVGFNETTMVRVRPACRCGCPGQQDGGSCREEGSCRPQGGGPECSGRGTCVCGVCECDRSRLGIIHGKYCQLDDFSCPYHQGLLCGGRGQCVSGECRCQTGWTGETCECPISTEACRSGEGPECGGRGRCVCGRCQCNDPRRSGRFCESCPTCDSPCQSHWNCVDCHLSNGFSEQRAKVCNVTCSQIVDYVDGIPELLSESVKHCFYPSNDKCHYRFQMNSVIGSSHIHINRYPECLSGQRYYPTFLGVFLITVLVGLVLLVPLKLLLMRRDRALGDPPVAVYDGKEALYMPTTNDKTITYRRDRPQEMHIQVHKMPLTEVWQ